MNENYKVGVLGAGSMGTGIAQVAATNGHQVVLFDSNQSALDHALKFIQKILNRQVEKGRMDQEDSDKIYKRIKVVDDFDAFEDCQLVIEAIVENLEIKKEVFKNLEAIVSRDAILATNTSSLSIISIAAACKYQERVLGVHFFNPAPLMPLVEIIPSLATDVAVMNKTRGIIDSWGKTTVQAKDTPGFIVNRLARPFYGEAIRIYEEGLADFPTIDWAMKEVGGFKMGPFELMDYIGNDINYTVTETVFREFFYDPRYKPSFTQKRLYEAGRFGRKTGIGYYDYREGATNPQPVKNEIEAAVIVDRIVAMLINEAADALFLNIATKEDLDLAMTKGVNYPKGLLAWADHLGIDTVYNRLKAMFDKYGEDRYRPSPILKMKMDNNQNFLGKVGF